MTLNQQCNGWTGRRGKDYTHTRPRWPSNIHKATAPDLMQILFGELAKVQQRDAAFEMQFGPWKQFLLYLSLFSYPLWAVILGLGLGWPSALTHVSCETRHNPLRVFRIKARKNDSQTRSKSNAICAVPLWPQEPHIDVSQHMRRTTCCLPHRLQGIHCLTRRVEITHYIYQMCNHPM